MKKGKLGYGALSEEYLYQAVNSVCEVLGNGSNNTADKLILGTMAVETCFGYYEDDDGDIKHGIGITQIDKIAFDDIKRLTREKHIKKIEDNFGININFIEHQNLAYNPLLSIIFTRLYYLRIPEPIGTSVKELSSYWKKYYNTSAGKGTKQHFIEKYEKYINKGKSNKKERKTRKAILPKKLTDAEKIKSIKAIISDGGI